MWATLALCACATTKDAARAEDARLDEVSGPDRGESTGRIGQPCGNDAVGDVLLIDAHSGTALSCVDVTVSAESMDCPRESACPAEEIYRGPTNRRGQVPARRPFANARLSAVADGFAPSFLANATFKAGTVLELEMLPLAGYWLKVVDQDGNYLPDVVVIFKKGEDVLAALRTNALANLFFAQRTPFQGEPVTIEVQGYQVATISGPSDLGDDGHTLTLKR